MKTEYRKVYKDLYVGGESHKVGDKVLTLPEHNTETEVAVGTDMGVFMVDFSYFKNDLRKEWTAADNGKVQEIIVGLKYIQDHQMISLSEEIKWLQELKYRFDKVEPKFHEGEWITNSIETVQITGYDIDYGYQVDYKGNLQHRDTDIIEKEYHLWTIQDAKDGDILATWGGAFIYNGNNGGGSCPGCYCGINTLGRFKTGTEHHWTGKKVYPATKEQRDTLFAKMREAGYEWDAEKKELREIEKQGEQITHEDIVKWSDENPIRELWDKEKVIHLLKRMIWDITYEDLEGNSTEHYDKMEFIEDLTKAMEE